MAFMSLDTDVNRSPADSFATTSLTRGWTESPVVPRQGSPSLQLWVRGYAWKGNRCFSHGDFARFLHDSLATSSQDLVVQFSSLISDLNGSFAVIVKYRGGMLAAVDRLRSIPLFYGVRHGLWIISDVAESVGCFVDNEALNDLAMKEFLLTAYVTGPNTLLPDVKQLQSGELLCIAKSLPQKPKLVRYYRFLPGSPSEKSATELREDMDEMHLQVFRRLAKSANGRRIVLPLSGGLDSRLVAAMLKKVGYDNVLCFSYGRLGNWEAEISQRVAERLGYEWHFVHYTWKKWKRWFNLPECRQARIQGCNLASRSSIQDWPAVFELKRTGVLQEDDLLTPGHSGDFLAGSHIPPELTNGQNSTLNAVVEAVLKHHFIQWKWRKGNHMLEEQLISRILAILHDVSVTTPRDAVGAFEMWDWQERQAKYIVNSVRTYESLGFEWRIPLWDNAVMDFWRRTPLQLRIGKEFYDKVLEEGIFAEYGINRLCRDRLAAVGARDSRVMQQISRLWAKLETGIYQVRRGAQGRYGGIDRFRTWHQYRRSFGNGIRSAVYPLHVMPVGTSHCLSEILEHADSVCD